MISTERPTTAVSGATTSRNQMTSSLASATKQVHVTITLLFQRCDFQVKLGIYLSQLQHRVCFVFKLILKVLELNISFTTVLFTEVTVSNNCLFASTVSPSRRSTFTESERLDLQQS